MSDKSYLSIKEFANFSQIEMTTLRYWDEIGLLTPAHRNPDNGYRYYSPDQIITVNFIKVLSDLNVRLKTIMAISDNRTPEIIIGLFDDQQAILDMEMHRIRQSYSIIHILQKLIKSGFGVDDTEIAVHELDEMAIILGPPNNYDKDLSFYRAFMSFCDTAKLWRINLNYPIGACYDSIDAFTSRPGLPNCFFSIDPIGSDKIPQAKYLVGYARGGYGEMGDLPSRMTAYAKQHGLVLDGPVFVVYIQDEICLSDPQQYLARVSVAIRKGKGSAD
jgi:DNA-binding transcriptional MerR regulator